MKQVSKLNWKYVTLSGVVLVALIFGTYLFLTWGSDTPQYEYLKVEKGRMKVTLREIGAVGPEHRLNVTPPIPGRIDSVNVENGAEVKQGQVLAWISSTDRAALMDAARAAGGKEVDFWKDIYKPAPLVAPLDGHIISTSVVPGQVVVAAQTVFTMSDHLIVQANVDETDLNDVKLGQAAEITFDSFPGAKLKGTVQAIAYDATTVNNVTTYLVNIFLDETPDYVRSGISTNVFLLISDRKNVLRVPTSAISPEGTVLVVEEQGAPPVVRKIKTGLSDGNWTEVLSGLDEGDWIARRVFAVKAAEKDGFSFMSDAINGKKPPKRPK